MRSGHLPEAPDRRPVADAPGGAGLARARVPRAAPEPPAHLDVLPDVPIPAHEPLFFLTFILTFG